MALSFRMTAGNDNETIIFIKITNWDSTGSGADATYRIIDKNVDGTGTLSISGNSWESEILSEEIPISEIDKSIDFELGGTLGTIANVEFATVKDSPSSDWANFINEWFPEDSNKIMTHRLVQFGVGWEGIDNENKITWLYNFYIEGQEWGTNTILWTAMELWNLNNIELPFYEIQKDYDNEISYFPNAPSESYGLTIPAVYGKFPLSITILDSEGSSISDVRSFEYNLAPTVAVDKQKLEFLVAYHKSFQFAASQLYKYAAGIESYIKLSAKDDTGSVEQFKNSMGVTSNILLSLRQGGSIVGQLYIHPNYSVGDIEIRGSVPTNILKASKEIMERNFIDYFDLAPGEKIIVAVDAPGLEQDLLNQRVAAFQDKRLFRIYTESTHAVNNCDYRIRIINLHEPTADGRPTGGYAQLRGEEQEQGFVIETFLDDVATPTPAFTLEEEITMEGVVLGDLIGRKAIMIQNIDSSETLRVYQVYWEIVEVRIVAIMRKSRYKRYVNEDHWLTQSNSDYIGGRYRGYL